MVRYFQLRLCVLAVAFGLIFSSLGAQQSNASRGRKFKAPPPTARIEVSLVRETDGKPIENAAVVFHAMKGEKDTGNMELKTNEDGKTIIDVMPIGDIVRLQIIAKGYQTYGGDYKIDKAQMAIEIRLKRPGQQYSVYDNHPETAEGGKSPDASEPAKPPAGTDPAGTDKDAGKSEGASEGAAPAPATKDKPASQPDAQPSPSPSQPK